MSDNSTRSDYPLEPLGPDRPTWQKLVSRDLRELKAAAEALLADLELSYGKDLSGNPDAAGTLWRIVRERGLIRAFEATFARAIRAGQVDNFEGRLDQTLADLKAGRPPSPRSVPISFAYYVGEAVEQTTAEKEKGELPDYETPDLILRLGADLLDHPDLAPWRGGEPTRQPPGEPPGKAPDTQIGQGADATFIGRVLGRHRLTKRLGKGGFAEVFEAEHLDLHVVRALKILSNVPPSGPARAKAHEGLLREARTQVALDHPNVVRLLDAGDEDGCLYLVMDYVEGRTLAQLIHEKTTKGEHFTAAEILEVSMAVAEALRYAHAHQIVHRDLKPENILIRNDGRVLIGDFGLSRRLAESGHRQVTQNGYLIGTPQYMAPEQVGGKGNTYDHRADLYSLGVVLYQMALGVVPFDDEDIWAILRMHREEDPVRLADQKDGFPAGLEDIILRCLKKKPEDRFSDAAELLEALNTCRDRLVVESMPEAAATRKAMRRGMIVAAAGVLSALGIWIFGFSGFRGPGATGALTEQAKADQVTPLPAEDHAPPRELEKEKQKDAASAAPTEKPLPADAAPPAARDLEKTPLKAETRPEPGFLEKIAKHAVTPAEAAAVGDLLELFSTAWPSLRGRSYDALQRDLSRLEAAQVGAGGAAKAPDEKKYLAHQFQAARELIDRAKGAIEFRFEELKRAKEPISLLLANGSRVEGLVESFDQDGVTLKTPTEGRSRVLFSKLATDAFLSGSSPASATLALQVLSGTSTAAFREIMEASRTQEALVSWLPVAMRLARHEIEGAARAAVGELKPELLAGTPVAAGHPHRKTFSEVAQGYLAAEAAFLEVYGYLGADFDRVRREGEALDLLEKDSLFQVLAGGVGTTSYPAAAEVVLARFTKAVEAEPLELLTKNGWFRYGWKLSPSLKDLKERLKYWEVDSNTDTSTLRAADSERRIAMGEGVPDARTGVVLQFQFEPESGAPAVAEWSFLLRTEKGAETLLRGDDSRIGLYRTVLEPGGKDAELRRAPLPPTRNAEGWRSIALLPGGEQLHVFVDGQIVMSLPATDAQIPVQMQFAALQAKVVIKSVRVRKAQGEQHDNR